jgi:hypothetical protein
VDVVDPNQLDLDSVDQFFLGQKSTILPMYVCGSNLGAVPSVLPLLLLLQSVRFFNFLAK